MRFSVLLSLALLGCAPSDGPGEAPARARNLIWVSLDTLRADRLGCYGYDRPTSPNLDRLAERGTVFEDASAPSPWTMPSHGTLFTGLWPSRHGLIGFETSLRSDVVHVAELLAQRGYRTAAVVSNGALTMQGLPRGFERLEFVERGRGPAPSEVTPTALEILAEIPRESRFFLLVHYNQAHARYRALPRYVEEFVGPYDGPVTGKTGQFLAHQTGLRPFAEEDVAHLSNLYDAAVRQLDDQLDALFRGLEADGRLAESLVVVTSDHGEEFFDHGGVNHGLTQYQELVRVPLIVVGPGVRAGARVRVPASLVDVLPTSLAWLGERAPAGLDGVDLGPVLLGLEGGSELPERHLYFEADCAPPTREDAGVLRPGTRRAVRDARYKLLVDLAGGEPELYDLERDPGERFPLGLDDAELAGRAAALSAELSRYLEAAPAEVERSALTAEELERLEELGYVGGEGDG